MHAISSNRFFISTEASEPSVAWKLTFSTSMAMEDVAFEDVYSKPGPIPTRRGQPLEVYILHILISAWLHHHHCFAGDPSKGRLLDHVGTENAPSLLWHPVQELGATAEGVDEGRDDGMNIGRVKGHRFSWSTGRKSWLKWWCEGWKPAAVRFLLPGGAVNNDRWAVFISVGCLALSLSQQITWY